MDFVIDHKTLQEYFHKTFGDSCIQANLVMTNREEIRQLAGTLKKHIILITLIVLKSKLNYMLQIFN